MAITAEEYLPEASKAPADSKSRIFQFYQITEMNDKEGIPREIPVASERANLLMLEEEKAKTEIRLAEINEKIAAVNALLGITAVK